MEIHGEARKNAETLPRHLLFEFWESMDSNSKNTEAFLHSSGFGLRKTLRNILRVFLFDKSAN